MLAEGVDGLKLADVAARARVTTGAIYSIFGSRSGLLAAMLESQQQMAQERLDDGIVGSDPPAAVARAHAEAVERLLATDEGRRAVRLEAELAGLAVRDPQVGPLVAAGRRLRLEQLARPLGLRLATALLALEQGWSLAVALGEEPEPGALPAAAAALAAALDGR